jgi:hypothetical protein
MTFKRTDMGHMQFTWVHDDPKTYTRANQQRARSFVLTPDIVADGGNACMEGKPEKRLIERLESRNKGRMPLARLPGYRHTNLVYDEHSTVGARTIWPNAQKTLRRPQADRGRSMNTKPRNDPRGGRQDPSSSSWRAGTNEWSSCDLTADMLKPGMTL